MFQVPGIFLSVYGLSCQSDEKEGHLLNRELIGVSRGLLPPKNDGHWYVNCFSVRRRHDDSQDRCETLADGCGSRTIPLWLFLFLELGGAPLSVMEEDDPILTRCDGRELDLRIFNYDVLGTPCVHAL